MFIGIPNIGGTGLRRGAKEMNKFMEGAHLLMGRIREKVAEEIQKADGLVLCEQVVWLVEVKVELNPFCFYFFNYLKMFEIASNQNRSGVITVGGNQSVANFQSLIFRAKPAGFSGYL